MKRIKSKKIVIILCGICIIIGCVLLGAGFALGGNAHFMSINKESIQWWPFEGSLGIAYFEDDDANADQKSISMRNTDRYEEKMDNMQNIIMEMDKGDVYIQIGEENKIIFENLDSSEWKLNTQDQFLNLVVKTKRFNTSAKIIIEVKKEELKKLDVKIDHGNLEVYDQNLAELDLECDLGNVSLYNVTALSSELLADAGNIDGKNVELNNAILEVDAGNITVDGVLRGKSELSNDMGNIQLKIQGNADAYGYQIVCELGKVTYNGETFTGSTNIQNQKTMSDVLLLENDMGNIEVSFYD